MGDNVKINGETKITGLFGDPVSHSLSPLMHNAAFRETGLNYCYLPFHVKPEALPAAINSIRALGMAGVNITAPHKENAAKMLSELSADAGFLNAVNTIKNTGTALKGFNTDVDGFIYLLDTAFAEKFKKALLLGAGGAARAVALALARSGINKLILTNRSTSRAEKLAQQLTNAGYFSPGQIELVGFEQRKIETALSDALVINGLSVDPVQTEIIAHDALQQVRAAVDLRYDPPLPPFLQAAQSCGRPAVNGLHMLLGQGLSAFEVFTGKTAPQTIMQKALEEHAGNPSPTYEKTPPQQEISLQKPPKNIYLIGFMGSGKTTIARLLADDLELETYDSDLLVAAIEGTSIKEIFHHKGEEYFRQKETEILRQLARKPPGSCVIATGGGAVLREENMKTMRKSGIVIYLEVSAQEAYERIKNSQHRPLLQVADPQHRITKLLQERAPFYRKAHFSVSTDGKTPSRIAAEICGLLKSEEWCNEE